MIEEEEKEVRGAVDVVEVHGVRYPEGMIQSDFADTPELEDEK